MPTLATTHAEYVHDIQGATHWLFLNPASPPPDFRPCVSAPFLRDLDAVMESAAHDARAGKTLVHLVIAARPPVFCLGGDLAAMLDFLRCRDIDGLTAYAYHACRSIWRLHGHMHPRLRTIAAVSGTCLGGGFEMALACDLLIAERDAKMGFPEAAFGSFAGVGAYSLLWRRVGQARALAFLRDPSPRPAQYWHEAGVVDVLVEPGSAAAQAAVHAEQARRNGATFVALSDVRDTILPLTEEELRRIADVWVAQVMAFDDAQVSFIQGLVAAQNRKAAQQAV